MHNKHCPKTGPDSPNPCRTVKIEPENVGEKGREDQKHNKITEI